MKNNGEEVLRMGHESVRVRGDLEIVDENCQVVVGS